MKRVHREEIFVNHMADKALVSKIHKELSKADSEKQSN